MEVTPTAQKFASAIANNDEAAARSCVREWCADGDGPARLFHQLVGQPVGLEVTGAAQPGKEGRAAQPVAIVQGGKPVEQLTLLGDGEPFLLTGVATREPHLARFLAGEAPAVVTWDVLPPDPAARDVVVALAETLARAATGQADASTELGTAMSSGPGAVVVVGYLAAAVSRGARIEVGEARGLPRIGRAAVSATILIAGSEPEQIFVYLDHATSTRWLAWTPYFSGDTLLAR